MKSTYVISLMTENTLSMLQRMSAILLRNRLQVAQMNLFETSKKGVSHCQLVIQSDAVTVERVIKQLQKIIELIEIKINFQMAEVSS